MTVLAVGAHPDDIELGCGAALRRYVEEGTRVVMLVLTDGGRGTSGFPSRRKEQEDAAAVIGAELRWAGLPDGELELGPALIDHIGAVASDVGAQLVLTHAPDDSHQDHIVTARATLAAARHLPGILYFETPSTLDFAPRVFCDVEGYVEHKLDALRCHLSQVVGATRVDVDALRAQMRFRGFQGRVRDAEAFEVARTLLVPQSVGLVPPSRRAEPSLELS